MKTLNDIRNILSEHKQKLFEKYPIKMLAIFGSYSKNKQKDDSDLDILVEFSERIGIEFVDLAEDLESILDIKVDLVSKKGIKKKYFELIAKDLIYV